MNNEIIQVNGKILYYKTLTKNPHLSNNTTTSAIETTGDIKHYINIDNTANSNLSNFVLVTVTPGYYLVLSDNRRHNADSRVCGFVPHHALRRKATAIAFSVNYNNYYLTRSERFLKGIYQYLYFFNITNSPNIGCIILFHSLFNTKFQA